MPCPRAIFLGPENFRNGRPGDRIKLQDAINTFVHQLIDYVDLTPPDFFFLGRFCTFCTLFAPFINRQGGVAVCFFKPLGFAEAVAEVVALTGIEQNRWADLALGFLLFP